jgi:hypothetical protein
MVKLENHPISKILKGSTKSTPNSGNWQKLLSDEIKRLLHTRNRTSQKEVLFFVLYFLR